jgi:Fe-S-cluster containining protein
MMGKNADGDLCPFLDVESGERSPHGGFNCRIYPERPLACRAYPVIDADRAATLDGHCQFCKKFSTTKAASEGLQQEVEALARIKSSVTASKSRVWRYATATGRSGDVFLPEGWVAES